jgi:hypothetical protein
MVLALTIVGVTLLHPQISTAWLLLGPLSVVLLRCLTLPRSYLSLRTFVHGCTIAILLHRIQHLYPFATLYGYSVDYIEAGLVTVLLFIFVPEWRLVWAVWPVTYVTWFGLNVREAPTGVLADAITWFWSMELLLHIVFFAYMYFQKKVQKDVQDGV